MIENAIESMLNFSKPEAIRSLEKEIKHYSGEDLSHGQWPESEFDEMRRDWAVDVLLLRWLQHSTVSADPRHRHELERQLEDYNRQHPEADLQLDSLLIHGAVRVVWDSFSVPRCIIFNRGDSGGNFSCLMDFLTQLSKVPHSYNCKLILRNPESSLKVHRSYYGLTPELTWFVEQDILIPLQGGYALNSRSGLIRYFCLFLLSRLWEERVVGPLDHDERLNWWIRYVESIGFSKALLKILSQQSRDELLDASVRRLLQEEDLIGWESERNKWVSEELADYSDPRWHEYVSHLSLPESEIDKLFWHDGPNEAALTMHEPRQLLSVLFNWIVEEESIGGFGSDRPRLRALLAHLENRPFFYQQLSHIDPVVIPAFLTDPDLASIGLVLLAKWEPKDPRHLYSMNKDNEILETELRIWSDALPFFSHSIRMLHQQPDQAAQIFEQVLTWFESEIRRKSTVLNQRAREAKRKLESKRELFMDWLQRHFVNREPRSCDAAILTNWTDILLAKTEKGDVPLAHPSVPQLLWLVQLGLLGTPGVKTDEIASRLIHYYKGAYQTCCDEWTWISIIDSTMRDGGWLSVLQWAAVQADNGKPKYFTELLQPFSVDLLAAQEPQVNEDKYKWNRAVSTAISVHLERLTLWMRPGNESLDKSRAEEVQNAFADLLVEGIKQHQGVVFNPFSRSLGDNLIFFNQPANVVGSVGEALNSLPDKLRESTLIQLIDVGRNIGLLAKLYNHLKRELDKRSVMEAIRGLKDATGPEDYPWVNQIQVEVIELLNTRNPELAEVAQKHLDRMYYFIERRGSRPEDDWVLREQLRIYLIKKEYEKIRSYDPSGEDSEARRNLIRYYQALSLLDSNQPTTDIDSAIRILRRLLNKDPLIVSYMVNLYYACVLKAIHAYENDEESYPSMIEEAEKVLLDFQGLPKEITEPYFSYVQTTRLMFYQAIRDSWRFWQVYYLLAEQDKYTLPIGIYAVLMYMEEKRWMDAARVLEDLRSRHGHFEQYDQLKKDIKSQEVVGSTATPKVESMLDLNKWQSIGQSIRNLGHLSPQDQVNAIELGTDVLLEEFILKNVLDVCREVQKYSPCITPSVAKQAEEDRYTDLFVLLFNQRMMALNWTAFSQSRGGYTGKPMGDRGGIGERDIVIQNGSRKELLLIEALKLSTADKNSIMRHFLKIFGYDTTRSYSYLILVWGFGDKPEPLWTRYQEIIRSRTNGPFSVIESGDAIEYYPRVDFQGVKAYCSIHQTDMDGMRAKAIHLYVDIKAAMQRGIAAEARH